MTKPGPPQPSEDDRLEDVLAECRQRLARGEHVDIEELIAAHPAHTGRLREFFATNASTRSTLPPSSGNGPVKPAAVEGALPEKSRETQPPRHTGATNLDGNGPSPAMPKRLGRYQIERCLGEGAMGAVYLALDTQLDRRVALKIPNFKIEEGSDLLERFYREAKAAATLRNANICPVHDVGEHEGVPYISMAYIAGTPLSEKITRGGFESQRETAGIVKKLALALEEAHTKGIVHRDLKPSNIMMDEKGDPIIMDFGLARRAHADDARLTQSGAIIGSPAYMSPEQVEGDVEIMGPACDIYSLGVILYELLTGELPFKGSIAAVMGQIIMKEPPKPSEVSPDVDSRLDAICVKMMAKQVEDRCASMRAVADDLSDVISRPNARSTKRQKRREVQEGALVETSLPAGGETMSGTAPVTLPPGTAVIPRWVLWTVAIGVAAAIGLTWWMMALFMRHTQESLTESPTFHVHSSFQQAMEKDKLEIYLDSDLVTAEEFKKGLHLNAGDHTLEIRKGDELLDDESFSVVEGESRPFDIRFVGGKLTVKPKDVEREAAEWVFRLGGSIVVGDETISVLSELPDDEFHVTEIDLKGRDFEMNDESLELLKPLSKLKRLDLRDTSVTDTDVEALQSALRECNINR